MWAIVLVLLSAAANAAALVLLRKATEAACRGTDEGVLPLGAGRGPARRSLGGSSQRR
jgi:hypothetical protein